MAEEFYTPNPTYYSDQIKEKEKFLKKLEQASYDSVTRKYEVDGESYTVDQVNKAKSDTLAEIADIKTEQKKNSKYGPEFGESAKSNQAGDQYEKLRKTAVDIKVTDYASAVANLQAWKAVKDFVEENPDIKVVRNVNAIVQGERGRNTRGTILKAVSVDPGSDDTYVQGAVELATKWAEKDTTVTKRVQTYGKPGANNAAYKTVKTVTNQETLDARLAEIDAIGSGTTVTSDVQRAARAPGTTPPNTKGKPASMPAGKKVGGQSTMNEEQTMAAYAGLSKMNKKGRGSAPAGTGTGTGTGTGGGTRPGVTTVTTPKPSKNWEAKFREMFPGNSWMLDIDRTKYSDVFKIFQDAVTNEAWLTEESLARFKAQLENSSFTKELKTTNKVSQIKSLIGDVGFDSVPFNTFLTKAMNMGWDDTTLKQEAYKEAFRKDDTGAFVNPTALTRVKASNDYLNIKKIGTSYFSTIDDDTTQQVLTGGMAQQDVERQQRELAKSKYGHLSNLLDQGFTLEKLTSSFKQQAAQLLEKDINSIDMSQADYEQVINSGEEGKKRMMTTGEWEIKLRSDPRYNWGSTQNAKDEARRLSASIAQAFGKVI